MAVGPRAVTILLNMWPYLGIVKREQAADKLLEYENHLDSFVALKTGPKKKAISNE